MRVHVGTSGFAYEEWKDAFYPKQISSKEMLRFYSERLSVVEINNTFYRMPTERLLSTWAGQVPDDFVFAFKAPQVITHVKRLMKVETEAAHLFRMLSTLGRRLGPVLFQFAKSFRADRPALEDFLDLIPREVRCAFAFRSPSWLDPEILDMLRERGHSLCIEDTDEDPTSEIISAAPWGYLRLRRADYTDADLSRWMDYTLSQGWETAFVFFKEDDEAKAPEYARRFRELVGSTR
jgi:uncharacterized protein YecE (DUF72 family)